MRRLRRCKIVVTLGPSSSDRSVLSQLFRAGADVFRINMSHASHDDMREKVRIIRSLETEFDRPIAILLDLQGPKLRVGTFANGPVELAPGAKFMLDCDPTPGNAGRVYLPHPEILRALEPGHRILVDDGKVCLKVIEATPEHAIASVIVAGTVSNRKGVSLPDTDLPVSSLDAGLQEGVDWIAVSFVQRPEDVAEVKKTARGRALVMTKIEKPQAISRLDEIMEISDGLMVARGDLGVEMPLEKVPGLQKRITRTARRLGKPVVVATQMLESMISSPVPTRAEVSDVATAVFEGADAIMLSAESAAGKYPVEAVTMMNKIAEEVELDHFLSDDYQCPARGTGSNGR
jgi:pyruvate kinase